MKTTTAGRLRFSHLAFYCRHLQRSVEFYRDVLGAKESFFLTYGDLHEFARRTANEHRDTKSKPVQPKAVAKDQNRKWIVYLELSAGQFIELFDSAGAFLFRRPRPFHLNFQHFSLEVDDLKRLREELLAKGVKIVLDIRFGPDQTYQMWIRDPDGNRIELMQYTEKSWQLVGRP